MPRRSRLLIPVAISLLVQVPAALFWLDHARGPDPRIPLALLALALFGPLMLLAARRFPGPVVAIVSAAACADFLLSDPHNPAPPYLALAFAIGSAVVRGARVWAWASVGAGWIATVAIGLSIGVHWSPGHIAATAAGVLLVFGIAESIRSRREHFEEHRRAFAQRKQTEVQAERVRIARELHDVLAHSLSQINVQAGVALHLIESKPDAAAEALASIKETSKSALDEVRSVLGVLRADGDPDAPLVPEPDLSRLPGLVASVTAQGIEVTLANTIEDAPQAVQLAIYRIVQESLTNVLRHAKATKATVEVREDEAQYVVMITDNGVGLDGTSDDGRGLLGMRERAELLGGSLEVQTGKGLTVTARIPRRTGEAP
ncbi:MAG: sensor histidine kinase [Salinibacterium sp.]|nr:MAG: sensor histidine kinase [Salinibacterium sp.]